MIQRSLLVRESDLARYIRESWRGFDTKDYELLAAVLLARLHKQKFRETFHIALPVKMKIGEYLHNEYSYDNVKKAISFLEEDTPVDIAVVPETTMGSWPTSPSRRPRIKSQSFQLKRVGVTTNGDRTREVLTLLANIQKKYSSVEAGLVLVIGGSQTTGSLDLAEIKKKFQPIEFPFKAVFFLTANKKEVVFGQLWPNLGCTRHKRKDLFGDMFI